MGFPRRAYIYPMDHAAFTIRTWQETDLPHLLSYLQHLDAATRSRFAPHPFTAAALHELYHHPDYTGFLVIEPKSTFIIGYALIKKGYLEHDYARLAAYGIVPNSKTDATYAPSLAKEWQGQGLGALLWEKIRKTLQTRGIRRVILWGGVQAGNEQAIRYYQKLGFREWGRFQMNGMENLDMTVTLATGGRNK